MKFRVDFWLLIADGYNLLMGICSVPLSTSHTNMSRSEQAVPEAQLDLEINLFFFAGSLTVCMFFGREFGYRWTIIKKKTYLEVKANSIKPHLTF